MANVSRIGNPEFLRLDLTPTWYGRNDIKRELAPKAVALIMQSELRPLHREMRFHLHGIELEVANCIERDGVACDVRALGAALRERIQSLAT